MLNNISIQGRITEDPVLNQTQSGVSVCSFAIAVERDYAQSGHRVTDFFTVTAWRGKAEFICRNFGKGQPILIRGKLIQRKWTDKEGNKRSSTEIDLDNAYFCGSKVERTSPAHSPVDVFPEDTPEPMPDYEDYTDDDLPFIE